MSIATTGIYNIPVGLVLRPFVFTASFNVDPGEVVVRAKRVRWRGKRMCFLSKSGLWQVRAAKELIQLEDERVKSLARGDLDDQHH
jgi:hypothetical protein